MSEPLRIEVHLHHHYEGEVLRKLDHIMASMKDLNDKIDAQAQDIADLGTAIDALIASDAANFEALKAALAASDPAAVDAAIAKIDAAHAALAAAKDRVVAADATDNLP